MPRASVWVQLVLGWLPIWALYSVLILSAHPGTQGHSAFFAGLRAVSCAALLGLVVHRLTLRFPWPRFLTARWILVHVAGAVGYALSWVSITLLLEAVLAVLHGAPLEGSISRTTLRVPIVPFVIIGIWLYAMVAAIAYATQSTARAANAEALAAQSHLAALRSQLNPHFLFNALHTVMQLIPVDPRRASDAAERLGGLLRTSLEERRDLVPLEDEWRFVERYLALERLRFGDRLQVTMHHDDGAFDCAVPSFALQTLVENAVRHGAAPREVPTMLTVHAHVKDGALRVTVHDDGVGSDAAAFSRDVSPTGMGTGLARLRERLHALFGSAASLAIETTVGRGFTAALVIPVVDESAAA